MTAASGYTAAEVEAAVRRVVAERRAAGEESVGPWAPVAVYGALGLDEPVSADPLPGHWRRPNVYEAMTAQAKRALDKLAAEGELYRQGRNDLEPNGRKPYAGTVKYWTPEGAARARAERAERREVRKAIMRRWEAVNRVLADRGLFGTHLPHESPKLSLATWEDLTGQLAERGPS
jgi:hypothetical protein